jgi:hypothetical protein
MGIYEGILRTEDFLKDFEEIPLTLEDMLKAIKEKDYSVSMIEVTEQGLGRRKIYHVGKDYFVSHKRILNTHTSRKYFIVGPKDYESIPLLVPFGAKVGYTVFSKDFKIVEEENKFTPVNDWG